MKGFPGLMATPWVSSSLPGTEVKTSTVWSRIPAEEPPETTTTSASSSAASTVRRRASASSRTRPASVGSAPALRQRAARL